MRTFKYRKKWKGLLTEMVFYLTQIHEFKGKQTLFIEAQADTLTQLVEIAKIQSTEALLRTKVKFYQLRSEIKKSPPLPSLVLLRFYVARACPERDGGVGTTYSLSYALPSQKNTGNFPHTML